MKVLVIGQGGREHALVRALRLSPSVNEVHVLPGSDGMATEAVRHKTDWQDFAAVKALVHRLALDLVVVGPEIPLAAGLSDALRDDGIRVFGPSCDAAQLESSKVFSKRFMIEAGVPTAASVEVRSVEEVSRQVRSFRAPYVLKADGLAAGKGVFICKDEAELMNAAWSLFEEGTLGNAGERALLEEFQSGWEISCLVLTNGETWEPLILAADHKRLQDGDRGPNTGGMGTVAPFSIDARLRERIDREVFAPLMRTLQAKGLLYRGVLYAGLMITERGPSVLEFNVRFGDPEAQVILPLLDGDWGQVMRDVADGHVPELKWKSSAAACVVLAGAGYPDAPRKGDVISGDLGVGMGEAAAGDSYVLHAGTEWVDGQWRTAGGRVLNCIGLGQDLSQAMERAYAQVSKIHWPGMQFRSDIGQRVLGRVDELNP